MAMQTYNLTPARIDKFKGEILAHAVPFECLGVMGRQISMPKNGSKTYVARRWLPYGATAANSSTINQFFANGPGDRGNTMVQAHQIQEGITPPPDSITPQDIQVIIQQYGCLYGYSDQTADLYEDDIPAAMTKQVGERVSLVNEMICYGALKACTNQFFGGTGTTTGTVNAGITLGMVRKITKSLKANHGMQVTSILKAAANFATAPIESGYVVYTHTDLDPDIRDIPGFIPVKSYATGTPMKNEIGSVEQIRFVTSPDLPSLQDAGAAVGATQMSSTSGVNIDVYPFIVTAEDAWGQIAVRGVGALDPTVLLPGDKQKGDPFGQRGYVGTTWYKAVLIENQGWMAVGFVGSRVLV